MFRVEKCEPETRVEVKYPNTHVTMGQMTSINGEWITYLGAGEAKCDKGDKFNKDFGVELAATRAEIALLKNYESKLILLTKESEWKKKKRVFIHPDPIATAEKYLREHYEPNTSEFKLYDIDGKVLKTIKVTEE